MILFSEAVSLSEVDKTPGQNPCCVFVGRMQPPTLAHINILKEIYNQYSLPVFIFIVKASNSSSPFPGELIKKILEVNLQGNYHINIISSGFIGDWLNILRKENYEPKYLFSGTDRETDYSQQIKRYEDLFNLDIKLKVIPRGITDISATKAREYLRKDDLEGFINITTPQTAKFFEELKKYLL